MIKIMNPSLTLSEMVNDTSNGLGVITPISGEVREKLNGEYEFTFTVGMSEKRYSELACGTVVQVEAGETTGLQLFRIYKITKPMNGIVTVYARHITYDLNKAAVMPFSATGASAALSGLTSHLVGSYPFTVSTDISNTSSTFAVTQPVTFRSALGGVQGSILDVFGGEYEWDNLSVILHAHRGSDSGVVIEYGKNLTDIQQDENIESTYTAVLGFATNADSTVTGTIQYVTQTASPKTKIVDFSSYFDTDDTITVSDIDALAQAYIAQNNIGVPKVSINVKYQPLWQTEEYKNFRIDRVKLGDTVTVKFEKLGVEAKAKVVETVWDVVQNRYKSIQIGDARSTLAATINEKTEAAATQVQNASSFLESYIANITALVANSLGLFKTIETEADGSQKIYLHNRPNRADSQYQWTINSSGFFLSQDYGQTWTAGIDSDGNAVFNSLAANEINALTINGSTINGSVVVFDPNGKPVTAAGSNIGEGGVLFRGEGDFSVEAHTIGLTGTGQINSEQELQITGYSSDGVLRNTIQMIDSRMMLQHYYNGELLLEIMLYDGGLTLSNVQAHTSLGIYRNGDMNVYLNNQGGKLAWIDDGQGHSLLGIG